MSNGTVLRLPPRGCPSGSGVLSAAESVTVSADGGPAEHAAGSSGDLPDQVLVSSAAAGDDQAWKHIVTRHGAYLVSIGRRCRLSRDDVADAVQETWLNAFTHLADLRDHAHLRSWLGAIMWRSCMKVVNSRSRDHEKLVGDFAGLTGGGIRDERVDLEHDVLAAERSAVVRRALSLLPEREREILRQCVFEDRSYDDITRHLSMPIGSIGPTRRRALQRLRGILERAPGDDLLRTA